MRVKYFIVSQLATLILASFASAYNFENKIQGRFNPSRSEVIAKNLEQLRSELILILQNCGVEKFSEESKVHFGKFAREAIEAQGLASEDESDLLARLEAHEELSLPSIQRAIDNIHPVELFYGKIYED